MGHSKTKLEVSLHVPTHIQRSKFSNSMLFSKTSFGTFATKSTTNLDRSTKAQKLERSQNMQALHQN
jgi:hypothetical protein